MNGGGTEGGPWLQTLTTRLRALYAVDATPPPLDETETRLARELEVRVAALRGAASTAAARYHVGPEIDRGGMARVVLAHDALLHRDVALKQSLASPDPAGAATVRARLRLLEEARALGRLQHPGIAPLFDLTVDGHGEPSLVMPRLPGRTFADVLAERAVDAERWPLARVLEILRRVAETMAYAHASGLAHRDLKPGNVMLGSFGEVYVVDWGLAAPFDGTTLETAADGDRGGVDRIELTAAGTVVGTPAYLAPERAAAAPVVGADALARADVYSVGAMLYEILAGVPPYAGERRDWTVGAVLAAIRERPPHPLPVGSAVADGELLAICARAMHREPLRRYGTMQALADDLRAWAEHRLVQAAGGGWLVRAAKWQRRNRGIAWTVAAALLVLLVTTAAFVSQLVRSRDTAEANAQAARGNLEEILDLAVVQRVEDLRRRAEADLWPAIAARVPAMEAWLAEADALRPTYERLRGRQVSLVTPASEPAADAEVLARAVWRRRALDEAVAVLDAFFAPIAAAAPLPLDSSVAAVRARVRAAHSSHAATIVDPAAAAAWGAAADAVRRTGRHGALELVPQEGLLPIGTDPHTGFPEFVHLATGTAPVRDGQGVLRLGPESGVVLVLLPGGEFWMGAATEGAQNLDPLAEAINEGPVHEVALAPFFAAKFELTQAQWRRATGASPSVHGAVSEFVGDTAADLHPVESVTWYEARDVLRKLGLALPTEAQWEYAARAGTSTPWPHGARVGDLLTPPAGNLADAASAAALGVQGWMATPGLHDGFVMHAPVGSFAPNSFGLFDTLGNVWEWCDDEYVAYSTPPVAGTGARPRSGKSSTVMYRGGAFDQPAQEARSANRAGGPPDRRHFSLGVRPVCAVAR